MTKQPPHSYTIKINVWAAIRDILVASLAKGQFLAALGGLIIIVMIIKMESVDVTKLAFAFLQSLKDTSTLGYSFSIILSLGWFFHSRYIKNFHQREIDRVVSEKGNCRKLY